MIAALLALSLGAAPFPAQCQSVLEQARRAAPGELREVLLTLPPPDLGSRRGQLPSLEAAIDALDSPPTAAERDAAIATLSAICEQAELHPSTPATANREALANILSRPQFVRRAVSDSALTSLAQRLWDFIKELLQQRAVKSYSNVARAVFLALVAVVALYLGWRVLRRSKPSSPLEFRATPEVKATRELTLEEWLAISANARAHNQPREAMRAEMRALLVAFAELGLTDRRGAATNREIARALTQRKELAEAASQTADLAQRFDSAIYGESPVGIVDAERFADDAARLRAQLGVVPS